jgi:hypothetical protein
MGVEPLMHPTAHHRNRPDPANYACLRLPAWGELATRRVRGLRWNPMSRSRRGQACTRAVLAAAYRLRMDPA